MRLGMVSVLLRTQLFIEVLIVLSLISLVIVNRPWWLTVLLVSSLVFLMLMALIKGRVWQRPFRKEDASAEGAKRILRCTQLIAVLRRSRELLELSQDTVWSDLDTPQTVVALERAIESLEQGREADLSRLKVLFAPTGPVQEISIAHGWSEEYFELSRQFDRLANS